VEDADVGFIDNLFGRQPQDQKDAAGRWHRQAQATDERKIKLSAQVHLNRANDLINQGKLDDTVPEYREAIRLQSEDARAPATQAF
jgi:hypothetical protein